MNENTTVESKRRRHLARIGKCKIYEYENVINQKSSKEKTCETRADVRTIRVKEWSGFSLLKVGSNERWRNINCKFWETKLSVSYLNLEE
jgi:hypothetical protein